MPMPTRTEKGQAMNVAGREGYRVPSQHNALACVVAQDDPKKTIWYTSGAEASAYRDALDLAEKMGARSKDGVDGGVSARKVFNRSEEQPETFRTSRRLEWILSRKIGVAVG